jgi:hypothetical protein
LQAAIAPSAASTAASTVSILWVSEGSGSAAQTAVLLINPIPAIAASTGVQVLIIVFLLEIMPTALDHSENRNAIL